MDAEAQYLHLKRLVDSAPDFATQARGGQLPPDTLRWLGQLHAIVEAQHNIGDAVVLRTATSRMRTQVAPVRLAAVDEIMAILFRALAAAEVAAPSSVTGAFIAVGNAFDALRALSEILAEATRDVLIVDPYMAEGALMDVAVLARPAVQIRLLSDSKTVQPGLAAAISAWRTQFQADRPLEARLSPARALHDRLVLVDDSKVWILTQSLKDLAARSPASITASDPETTQLKIAAYKDIWDKSAPI